MFGYSVILALTQCCYIIPISLLTITDSVYPNGLPRVNLYREFFAFFAPVGLFVYAGMTCNAYNFDISNHGLKDLIQGLRTSIFMTGLVVFLLISISTFVLVFLISSFGIDLVIGEALLYVFLIITVACFYIRILIKIQKLIMPLMSPFKLEYLEQVEKQKRIIVKNKGEYNTIS